MASKKLTSDEVNALMEGLQDSPQGLNIDVSASDDVAHSLLVRMISA